MPRSGWYYFTKENMRDVHGLLAEGKKAEALKAAAASAGVLERVADSDPDKSLATSEAQRFRALEERIKKEMEE